MFFVFIFKIYLSVYLAIFGEYYIIILIQRKGRVKNKMDKKNRSIIDAFNNAIDGVLYTFKNERNMKIHYMCAILVLFGSLFFEFNKLEMIILILLIGQVVMFEMINTAVEKAIDGITTEIHPLLKVAKDVAAGAVLISSIISVVCGYLLFYDKITIVGDNVISAIRTNSSHTGVICIGLVLISVVILKTFGPKGTHMKGGMPSGHSALAFSLATIIMLSAQDFISSVCAYLTALLVAQSRVEGEIHSFVEVLAGAIVGVAITLLVFNI